MTKVLLGFTAVLFVLGLIPWFSPVAANAGGAIVWLFFWWMVAIDLVWLMARALYKYIHSN